MSIRSRLILVGFLAVGPLAGCDDGRPPMETSTSEAKVSGILKVKGVPVEDGQISFNPSNAERQVGAFTARVGPGGAFTVSTYPGANIVKFGGAMLKANPDLGLTSRYCEVSAGDNAVDFDLLGDGDKPRGPTYARKAAGKKNFKK